MKKEIIKMMKKRILSYFVTIMMLGVLVLGMTTEEVKAETTASQLQTIVKKKLKKNYPFTTKDEKKSKRMVFGIMSTRLESFTAYEKISGSGSNTAEYFLFIGKATSVSNAKKSASSLKRYVEREKSSMNNYLSSKGKRVFKAAQIGSKGRWCWMIVASPNSKENKNAVAAIKKKM